MVIEVRLFIEFFYRIIELAYLNDVSGLLSVCLQKNPEILLYIELTP